MTVTIEVLLVVAAGWTVGQWVGATLVLRLVYFPVAERLMQEPANVGPWRGLWSWTRWACLSWRERWRAASIAWAATRLARACRCHGVADTDGMVKHDLERWWRKVRPQLHTDADGRPL